VSGLWEHWQKIPDAMKKKIYHLSSCSTCVRIIKELSPNGDPTANGFEMQDIKTEQITPAQLQEMHDKVGSYEALFSRRAQKYKSMGLKDKNLKEEDFRDLILEEYTFLKRPVMLFGVDIFVGNSKKVVAEAVAALEGMA
jgi:arsenate reductase